MAVLEKLAFKLYEILPRKIIRIIGKSSVLRPFRDFVLRKGKMYRDIEVRITREYLGHPVDFQFVAGVKGAARAKKNGVENTLLRDSMLLLKEAGTLDNAYVFDIGASFGFLSLVWANTVCKKNGKVFSFEPNPNTASAFRTSVKINNLTDRIVPEHAAVGKENGRTELFLRTTTSNVRRSPNSESSIFVELICLDDYIESRNIQKCDLIKIDVDGTEYEVLQGASKTIDRFSPILIVETNQDKRIIHFLKDKGYIIKDMKLSNDYSDEVLPLNILCVKAGT